MKFSLNPLRNREWVEPKWADSILNLREGKMYKKISRKSDVKKNKKLEFQKSREARKN